VPELEVPQYFGGARDGSRQERQVQQLHDVIQDSCAAAGA